MQVSSIEPSQPFKLKDFFFFFVKSINFVLAKTGEPSFEYSACLASKLELAQRILLGQLAEPNSNFRAQLELELMKILIESRLGRYNSHELGLFITLLFAKFRLQSLLLE